MQRRELAIDDERPNTVTGGMAFAGGPLNHFTFHALVKLAEILRADRGSAGYLSAVSGILTKQGASVWSSEPGRNAFGFDDVTDATARDTSAVEIVENASGDAVVATYTVLCERGAPVRSVLLCDLADGRRTIAHSDDAALAATAMREELCGRAVRLTAGRVDL
jgi:acetyl-CoA C-acetyltransferase